MSYLQEAFREAARREFAMIPDEEEIEYSFSSKFLRKMRGLLRAEAYGYWKYVNTAAKRVAIAVAIIVMLLTSAMAIKPIRERVIKFFVEVYEEYFEITFGKEDHRDIYSSTPVIPNNEWVDTSTDYADAFIHEIQLDNTGTYRAIVVYEISGTGGATDVIEYEKERTYS